MTTPLIGLAALVAKAQETVAKKDALKKAEGALKVAPNAARRVQAVEEIQSLQSALDWLPKALVYKQQYWTCLCGRKGHTPQGLFIQERHIRMMNSVRLIRPRSGNLDEHNALPRFTQREYIDVLMCGVCSVTEHGFGSDLPLPAPIGTIPVPVRGVYTEEWETLIAPLPDDEPEEPQDGDEEDSDL